MVTGIMVSVTRKTEVNSKTTHCYSKKELVQVTHNYTNCKIFFSSYYCSARCWIWNLWHQPAFSGSWNWIKISPSLDPEADSKIVQFDLFWVTVVFSSLLVHNALVLLFTSNLLSSIPQGQHNYTLSTAWFEHMFESDGPIRTQVFLHMEWAFKQTFSPWAYIS